MFYSILKWYARLAIKIYCRRIVINRPELLQAKGPILLAANHPNSFLDGIIVTTLFDHPVYSLARGDVFRNKRINRFLRSIRLLPVWRTSEGVENLEHNYTTFASCIEAFKEDRVVLIFSEGKCENEWHLRPLKKGTARLALSAWEQGIPLQVIPTAFNYSSFKKFGKEVHLIFGEPLHARDLEAEETVGRKLLLFNEKLRMQLERLVYDIAPDDVSTVRQFFSMYKKPSFYFLCIPAVAGWILHAPLFYPAKLFTALRFAHSGHYDSVLTGLLVLLYPFYLLLCMVALSGMLGFWSVGLLVLLPLTAWACVQAKYQAGI